MPLVTCSDCSKQVSDSAPACIHCGRPLATVVKVSSALGQVAVTREAIQSAKRRNDVGGAVAMVGLPAALVLGVVTNAFVGWIAALAVLALAIWITYR